MRAVSLALSLGILVAPGVARADAADECLARLDDLDVDYERVSRRKVDVAVRIDGALGGVLYESYNGKPLVIDCSLAYSLARAGRFLVAAGVERVTYSSAYDIRSIRGTRRPSRHSFGLAIDVHTFHAGDTPLTVRDDYEQGLGDNVDCIGRPLTEAGALLKRLACQLDRSMLFRIILDPDFDAGHYNHFHLEALPWGEREDLRLYEGRVGGAGAGSSAGAAATDA